MMIKNSVAFLKNEKGYALPLVIGITLIILVIAMGIAFEERQKIKTAIAVQNKSIASMAAYSAMNQVFYTILTSSFTNYGLNLKSGKFWNLFGKPITLNQYVQVSLKDISGMISPLFHKTLLQQRLKLEIENDKQNFNIVDLLGDWEDKDDLRRLNGAEAWDYRAAGYNYVPRNFFIQTLDELKLLKDCPTNAINAIMEDLSYWHVGNINYLTMSAPLLKTIFHEDKIVKHILALREERKLTVFLFSNLTGILPSEHFIPWPSGWIKINIIANYNNAFEQLGAIIFKQQNNEAPFQLIEWHR